MAERGVSLFRRSLSSVSKKTAVITGGGRLSLHSNLVWSNSSFCSGIGLALAKQAAARGYNLILADINEDCLESAKKVLNLDPNSIQTKVCDVSKENEIRDLADFSFAQFGEFSLSCFPGHFFPYPHL
jgi:NAD(P)-dependent dehydrogenase (short-subunit alcohol dehydrogenase family)